MTGTRLILLPGVADDVPPVALSGDHGPGAARVVAIAPPDAVAVHFIDLPPLAPRQATAAARLALADRLLLAGGDVHVAPGVRAADGRTPVAVVATAQMIAWLDWAAEHGIDPDVILPATLILPSPETGVVVGDIGGHGVARSTDRAFPADPALIALTAPDGPVIALDQAERDTALAAALVAPMLNLRSGSFARTRFTRPGQSWWRWLAVCGGVALAALLIGAIAQIAQRHAAADRLDADAARRVASVLSPPPPLDRAIAELDAAAARAGADNTITSLSAAMFSAVETHPNVSIDTLGWQDGVLTVTLAAPRTDDLNAVLILLQQRGFTGRLTAVPRSGADGRAFADVTIRGGT